MGGNVGKKRGGFSPEFKEEATKMVVEASRSIVEAAREPGLNETTLGYCVKAYRERHAGTSRRWGFPSGRGCWSGATVNSKWRTSS